MRHAVLFAVLLVVLVGCAKEKEVVLPPLSASEITGERLWQRITVESDWDTYAHWPGQDGLIPGQSPHGKYHETYINAALASALPIASRTAPYGSIIVKENFTADRKLSNISVMAKVQGYDPEKGDWFWAKYDPKGKIAAAGKVAGCSDCHAGVKENDYIILWQLDAPLPVKE